jgi:hypothetical protein
MRLLARAGLVGLRCELHSNLAVNNKYRYFEVWLRLGFWTHKTRGTTPSPGFCGSRFWYNSKTARTAAHTETRNSTQIGSIF